MRYLLAALILAVVASDSVSQAMRSPAAEVKRVLITAFEPFDGSKENHTTFVAREVARLARLNPSDSITVYVCTLPVVYDVASETAKRCFESMSHRPDLVLSLGEVGSTVRVELVGQNRNSILLTDNSGEVAESEIISRNGPRWIPSTLALYTLSSENLTSQEWAKLEFSSNAGGYVCNNTAYTMGEYFKKRSIPYGFIHVPSYSGLKGSEKDQLARQVSPWITQLSGSIVYKLIKGTLETDTNSNDFRTQMRTFFSKQLNRKVKM